jgi:preprotein translocase subunit Sec63
MARFEMVNVGDIVIAKELTEYLHESERLKELQLIRKFGQLRIIVIGNVEGDNMVVNGNRDVSLLKELEIKSAYCLNLGEITRGDYLCLRIFLEANFGRLNYINIAHLITDYASNKEIREIANRTQIDSVDAERFRNLLTFDWEEFEKTPLNTSGQLTMF